MSVLVKEAILESYTASHERSATHYVWRNGVREKVWLTNGVVRHGQRGVALQVHGGVIVRSSSQCMGEKIARRESFWLD